MKKTTDYEIEGLKVSLPLRVAQYRYQYPGQYRHQSAYIELDPSDKTLRCDWNGEIGAVQLPAVHQVAGCARHHEGNSPRLRQVGSVL